MVSVLGRMGIPQGSPFMMLIVEKIASHEAIAIRVFNIFKSASGGSQDDNWFQAERGLLGHSPA